MNSAAAVLAAETSASVPFVFRALSTLRPHEPRNFHTSSVRDSAELVPRFCQPSSIESPASPSVSSAASDLSRPNPKVRAIRPRTAPVASSHTSGSSISHSSAVSSAAAASSSFLRPTSDLARRHAP